MPILSPRCFSNLVAAVLGMFILVTSAPIHADIDPANMGKGDWIWQISAAKSNIGVSTNQQLVDYMAGKGFDFVVIKCGNYGSWWTQFDSDIITRFQAAGIKVLGYQRVGGGSALTAEINVGKQCLASGADGYIIDAEAEFEGKHADALAMMQSLRATYPNAFIAHAPFPYIDYHQTFPYVEFGTYCDAVMPQCYWQDIGVSYSQMHADLEYQWHKWHGIWAANGNSAAIKPIVPIAQGYYNVPSWQISGFVNLLKNDTTPATAGGYKGVSFWSAQHHNSSNWATIGNITIGNPQSSVTLTVDNTDAGFSASSSWWASTSTPGYLGSNYQVRSTASVADSAAWSFTLAAGGNYDVYVRYSSGGNRASAAPYIVYHSGGSTVVPVNQQQNGGQWIHLGNFNFSSGTATRVRLSCWTSSGTFVIADAVRLEK